MAPRLSGPSRIRPIRPGGSARPRPSGNISLSSRNVSRIDTGSRCRRRKQNSRTLAEGRSIHCASSTASMSGAPQERIRRTSRIPRASTRRSGRRGPASERPADRDLGEVSRRTAISKARRHGPASAGRTSPAMSPNRSSRVEKASGLSAGAGQQDSTVDERPAVWSTCCHTMLLPIPASPVIASAAGTPDAAEKKAQISATSASRPTGLESTCHPRIGSSTSGRW